MIFQIKIPPNLIMQPKNSKIQLNICVSASEAICGAVVCVGKTELQWSFHKMWEIYLISSN